MAYLSLGPPNTRKSNNQRPHYRDRNDQQTPKEWPDNWKMEKKEPPRANAEEKQVDVQTQ